MKTSPYEACPPDETVAALDLQIRFKSGAWLVACPQWKFNLETTQLTRTVAVLLAEIENHNEGISAGEFDWNAFAAKNHCVRLKPAHWPKPAPRQFGRTRLIRQVIKKP